ncbi:extracellular calcium-sensing receptor-like [Rana temporaria]|uniref:extracellular calcium-sensing receptor-like n=1 Tax=Rana temporaria TaxID=8407 RepID=UPI001AADE423|nr:extracellular calcium-sensing receptor-like [Rana temporaria]
MGELGFPENQISHFSTSSLLSDRTQFASFFRTVPSDAFQSKGLAKLVLNFGWTWVGLVAVANDYGQQGIQVIKHEILKSGACVEFTVYIQLNQPNHNILQIVQVIKESTAQAIVVFSTDVNFFTLLDELLKENITDKIWVASEAWSTSSLLTSEKYSKLLAGTIGFAFYSGNIPGLKQHLDQVNPPELPEWPWNWMFWEESVGCTFLNFENILFPHERPSRNCTEEDKVENFQIYLKRISSLRIVYNLHSAVYVVAKALHELSVCRPGNGPFVNRSCSDIWNFKPWQILHYMKNVRIKLSSGQEMFFNDNGDPSPMYDIVNWQLTSAGLINHILVGQYGTTALRINTSTLKWTRDSQKIPTSVCSESCPPGFRKAAVMGKPHCCFQCIPCPLGEITNQSDFVGCFKCPWDQWPNQQKDRCIPKNTEYLSYDETLGVILLSTGITSSVIPVAILGILVHHKTTPIVRANNYTVSCLLLISMSLCFLSSLAFIDYPTWEKCLLRQVTFGLVFAFCVSCILAKTLMVMTAFKATKPNSDIKKWATPAFSYMVIGLGTFFQLVISVVWLSLSPPFPVYNLNTKAEVLIAECNEGSLTAFWCTIGYLSLLALASFVVAFLARQLPASFNEAKYITFSMLAFLSVWISYIPASLSTSGKYTVAMEIFAILSSSWATLCFMFVPKCYIILFRPSMNSRKHLLGKK